jgi:hypothetical protein
LEQENAALKTTIICLRRELEIKQGAVGGLELALRQRLERNRQLDVEAERLVDMIRLPPVSS